MVANFDNYVRQYWFRFPLLLSYKPRKPASRTTFASHDLPQIIRKKLPHRMAHVQSWGNDELTESFRVNHALRESIEKALQLFVAPTLDMSPRI